ncbi:ABC transporter ATP-binding protein [Mycoplasmopsis arginini]|uniref:ABC transporter ATP-binding protein n=1 Tax=Mycoplasmopsis arginini TaxID=2094 RepID=UPI0027362786|nr:ABC transporter ATP-binding protein [Mycoplasmopsis arginini]MDP4042670.1 ABC transporter ATP-binding protein [Mycoplasmopsis arginini]
MHNLDPFKKIYDPNLTKEQKKAIMKQQKQLKWDSFKKLMGYLNYKKGMLFWIITFAILSAACLSAGTFLLGYIMDNFLTYDFLFGTNPTTLQENFDEFKFLGYFFLLITIYIFQQIFSFLSNKLSVESGVLSSAIIRHDAYKSLMKMPVSFFESLNTGELMSILTNDVDNLANGLAGNFNTIIITVATTIFSFGFMFYYSAYLTLITIVLFPLFLSLIFFFMKKAMPQFQKQQKRIADLNGFIEENLAAHHLIKSLNYGEAINEAFDKKNNKLYKSSLKASIYTGVIWPYGNVVINLLQLIIVIIAAAFAEANIGTGSNTTFTPGIIMAFVLYIRIMANNVTGVFENIAQVQIMSVSSVRLFNLINLKPLVDEDKLGLIDKEIKGEISFENVNFSYTNDENNLQLKNANFKAKKGQIFAIVGPTGAGKTTIINLLSKFYLPNSGTIKIDDYDITQINEKSWRDQISIVLQDTFLFKATIIENLRYANINATKDQIIEACHISKAHEFIEKLENGYDEIVEEGGANFSQGERQLLAITRAILANKNILILDEATSNIDTRTEKIVQKAMNELMKDKTSFIIAHRLSTILNADQILVVNEGKIIESGTHKELLAKKGFYEKMYNSSFSED